MDRKLMKESRYKSFLPPILQGTIEDDTTFIGRYLKIFEEILSGIQDNELKDNIDKETLDIIADLFHPRFSFLFSDTEKASLPYIMVEHRKKFNRFFSTSIDEFLNWFSSWFALVLEEDWSIQKKREVISRIIPLYKNRGTKRAMEQYLMIYTGEEVSIVEEEPFKVGFHSRVGISRIGGLPPYFFIVNVKLQTSYMKDKQIIEKSLEKIIDREKPVHTHYRIDFQNS